MTFLSFRHHFHDAHLASFTLGPRRELTVEIALDPVWNKEGPSSVSVRFGGIENYDEVASFFRALPQPERTDVHIAEVMGLRYVLERPNSVVIDLAGQNPLKIQSSHVTES